MVISTLFVETFDKNTLQSNGDVMALDTVTTKKIKENSSYNLFALPDNSKFLIVYMLPMEDEEGMLIYRFLLYDKDFKLLWKKEKPLGYSADRFLIDEVDAANDGTIAITGKITNEDEKSDMPFEKHMFVLTKNGTELKDYLIKPEGKRPTSIKTRFDKDNIIVCSGFYTEKGWQYGKGWYLMRINPLTKEMVYVKTGAFDKKFIVNPSGIKDMDKIKCVDTKDPSPELERYKAKVLQFADNGDILLITEQDYKTTSKELVDRKTLSGRVYTTDWEESHTYYFNDIIVVSFSADGNLQWIKRVPKMQKIIMDSFGSFVYAFVNNKMHFVYNWFPASKKIKPDETMLFSKKDLFTVYHVTMDLSGNFTTEELYTTVQNDFNMRVNGASKISDSEVLLHGVGDDIDERRLMKFNFR